MMENMISFQELAGNVLTLLKEQHYMDSTLVIYRRLYNRVFAFMKQNGIEQYTAETGEAFLMSTDVSKSTFTAYACAVRRLNDCVSGRLYRCHHGNPTEDVPEIYAELLQGYIKRCIETRNNPATLSVKRKSCTLFMKYIKQAGCSDISKLNTDTTGVSRVASSGK